MKPAFVRSVLVLLMCFASNTFALYSSSSPVLQLDSSNFKSKMKAAGGALVEFYAPWCGHCKSLSPEYEKAAKAAKGMVAIAAVDADAHKDLGQEYGVQGFPTLKWVYMDGDKIKSQDYNGGRSAKEMVAFAFEKAKALAFKRLGEKAGSGGSKSSKGSKGSGGAAGGGGGGNDNFYSGTDVVTLTDGNFADEVTNSGDLWFVEFYAPWCGHCKNLKPHWIESASDLKGKVKVGAVDCTIHQSVCSDYGVKGYPTIKFFGAKKSSPEDYQGQREASAIVSFGNQKWASQAPPPEVRELVDAAVWEKEGVGNEEGEGAKQLCFIAFLPDILDSKASGRKAYIKTMTKLADKFKDRPFSYLWVQGGAQSRLESNLNVGGAGYPALVAFKPKDAKFSTARGAFELEHVTEFVENLRKGKETVAAVQGELASIQTLAPWDGKDAAVQVEDEFSLDDLNEL